MRPALRGVVIGGGAYLSLIGGGGVWRKSIPKKAGFIFSNEQIFCGAFWSLGEGDWMHPICPKENHKKTSEVKTFKGENFEIWPCGDSAQGENVQTSN